MEEKRNRNGETGVERGRQMEAIGGWNHLSRGEASNELDCMPLAGVIAKAP